jgi:hypothetical protein
MTFPDPKDAFGHAIELGALSITLGAHNYAGAYMFMGEDEGKFWFKHSETRRYLTCRAS